MLSHLMNLFAPIRRSRTDSSNLLVFNIHYFLHLSHLILI